MASSLEELYGFFNVRAIKYHLDGATITFVGATKFFQQEKAMKCVLEGATSKVWAAKQVLKVRAITFWRATKCLKWMASSLNKSYKIFSTGKSYEMLT